jgi:hypothetical protein
MKEVLTYPGCLEPFGVTSEERYERFRRRDGATGTDRALAEHPDLGQIPVAKPDPAGGYRCPCCGHVVA